MADGTFIMESRKIAEALDRLQPEPSLHMDQTSIMDRAQAAVMGVHSNLGPVYIPRVSNLPFLGRTQAMSFSYKRSSVN
jgi:glutathione S-transferase